MVPAMLDVARDVTPDNYKRRSVSAIRHFPRGCGRHASPLAAGPDPGKLSAPETPVANGMVVPETVVTPKEEPKDRVDQSESLKPEKIDVAEVLNQIEVAESQRNVMANGTAEPPAVEMSKAGPDELSGPSGSSQPETVYDKPSDGANNVETADLSKTAVVLPAVKEEVEEANGTDLAVKVENLETSKESLPLPDFPVLLNNGGLETGVSKLYGPSKRREFSAIRHFPSGCGRNAAPMAREACQSAPDAMHSGGSVSEEPAGEQSLAVVRADRRETVEENIVRGSQEESVSKTSLDWSAMEESRRKKIPAQDAGKNVQEHAQKNGRVVGSGFPSVSAAEEQNKVTSVAPKGLESSCKGTGEIYKQDILKRVSKVDPEQASQEERSRKKALLRQGDKQVEKKSQSGKNHENETPCLDAKTQSQPCKSVVKEATGSMGKFAKMRKEKITKSQNWKHLETEEEGNTGNAESQGVGSVRLGLCADVIIVQALMAAANCPWRQGRQIGMVSQNATMTGNKAKKEARTPKRMSFSSETSSLPGNNAKKEVRMPKRKRLSFETPIYQPQNKSEDGEDLLPEDGEGEHALVIYQGTQELSVNVPPFGPSDFSLDGGCNEEAAMRIRVRKVLRLFQVLCRKLLQCEESKPKNLGQKMRVDLQASGILKGKDLWVNAGKPIVGSVPGIEVGDEFHYRAELVVVGLHRSYQSGIDFSRIGGTHLAISIVASVGHADEMDSSDVLIYSGSGGSAAEGDKPPQDQKLERGNLALMNCIDAKTPVRVIRGFKELRSNNAQDGKLKPFSTFTYDGLYLVEDHWLQDGAQGFSVYKFKLRRIPGQPEIALKEVKRSKKSMVREGLCIADISGGKEKIPISVVNTVDDERPVDFEYVTKMIYPSWYTQTPPEGCNCKKRCSDSEKCACSVKNGGEIPYNFNGAIVQAKPLVYECGPSCNCPPSCHNRVSQHGIKIRLEVFKTKSRGWGVRSLTSIPSGSFICEYIGELIQDKEAEQRSNDQYLFDIGHNYDDHDLWEGLPTLIPDSQSCSQSEVVEEDQEGGFTIDAAKYGNVGRFINHSCSPNLYAQNVLYDHGVKKMPHIMLFAAENIPPLQELTYHYNYTIDHVRDSEGNIKTKDCYCGSLECTGRLY